MVSGFSRIDSRIATDHRDTDRDQAGNQHRDGEVIETPPPPQHDERAHQHRQSIAGVNRRLDLAALQTAEVVRDGLQNPAAKLRHDDQQELPAPMTGYRGRRGERRDCGGEKREADAQADDFDHELAAAPRVARRLAREIHRQPRVGGDAAQPAGRHRERQDRERIGIESARRYHRDQQHRRLAARVGQAFEDDGLHYVSRKQFHVRKV